MSKNNSSFKLEDSYTVNDETDSCLDSIKDEIDPDHNNDDGNQLNHNKDFVVDVENIHEIKSEKDYRNSVIQNTIFVKEEFNIKEEILTYHNNDDNYGSYLTENVEVNNIKSRNIKIDTSNICEETKTRNTTIQYNDDNNPLYYNDNFGVDVDNIHEIKSEKEEIVKEEFNIKKEILMYHNNDDNYGPYLTENVEGNNTKSRNIKIDTSNICEETKTRNTTIQYNDDNNPLYYNDNLLNKIEPMSPEYYNIFNENIMDIKTEIDYNPNNFENLTNVLTSENEDVNNSSIINLESITNFDENIKKSPYRYDDVLEKSSTGTSNTRIVNTRTKIHIDNIKPYKCDSCDKSFSRKSHLIRHKILHTGIKPYKCDICGKSFVRKEVLSSHIALHTGDKPSYNCKICDKTFTLRKSLKSHVVIHSKNGLYGCVDCQKSYKWKGDLIKHRQIHTGIKYKCDVCGNTFLCKSYLVRHKIMHTNVKPYKCDVCNNSFKRKRGLTRHKKIHINIKPFKCDV